MENYGRVDAKTGLNQRVIDFLRSLNFLIDSAIERDVALVVFSGDAFRNQKPNPTLQREFARAIRRLTRHDIKVFLLVGNHDLPNLDKQAHSMAIYDVLDIDGVYVARSPEVFLIETKQGPVQVAALPHFSRSKLIASIKDTHPEYKNKTLTELNDLMVLMIENFVADLAAQVAEKPDVPAILATHASISTAKIGNEGRSILMGSEMTVLPSTLQRPEFDYVAMGHIHKFQDLSNGAYPHLVYSGSIDRVDFGEEREDKGFCLVRLVRRATTYEFMPTPARRFVTIDVECATDDPTAEVCKRLEGETLAESVVRVRVKVPAQLKDQIRKDEIIGALADAHYVAHVTVEAIGEAARVRNPHLTESQTPGRALAEFLKTRDDLRERQDELLQYGQRLIEELQARGLN
jgi:exonuclease SbcD